MERPDDPQKDFLPISLGDWLAAARRASVPCVGAEPIAEFERCDLLHSDMDGPHQERLLKMWRRVEIMTRTGFMQRWDCCASEDLKVHLAEGRHEWRPDFLRLTWDDPRFFEALFEYPRIMVKVWRRPWLKAEIVDGYPVEYRVFVKNGRVQGISSYYPQRPLARNDQHLDAIRGMTNRLLDTIEPPFNYWAATHDAIVPSKLVRRNPDAFDPGLLSATMDFIVARDGRVLLLEGGPAFGMGAHPCCFEGRKIEGVALRRLPKSDGPDASDIWSGCDQEVPVSDIVGAMNQEAKI